MRLRLRYGSQPAVGPPRMAHRIRWRVGHRMAVDRQLAIAMQEPLHHREWPYTLVSRLVREGDPDGTDARPQSQGRRYRAKTTKNPLVEPHLGLVWPVVALDCCSVPNLASQRSRHRRQTQGRTVPERHDTGSTPTRDHLLFWLEPRTGHADVTVPKPTPPERCLMSTDQSAAAPASTPPREVTQHAMLAHYSNSLAAGCRLAVMLSSCEVD